MARPPKFTDPDEFQRIADEYFERCNATEEPYTVNGLALALGLCRQSLLNYGQNAEFLDAVKSIRTRLEAHWEKRLAGTTAAGTIFWLKNQGWSDKTEQTVTATVEHSGTVTLEPSDAYLRMLNG